MCDKVSGDPNGPNQAVQSLIKRLAHRNANVQLYTLEVRLFSLYFLYFSIFLYLVLVSYEELTHPRSLP